MSKHKLWAVISPNKTIDGFIGGIICSLIVPLVMMRIIDFDIAIWLLLLCTVILSMFGQLVDLVESGFMRHLGVKDAGCILHGHGGMLDGFDSIMFVLQLLNIWLILLCTVILSMFGQLGDLVESGFKRHFGVKDSGRILPGHGGILDRFDSFMFVLPLLNIFLI